MSAENSSSTTTPELSRTTLVRRQLLKSFQDREYRHAFLGEHVRTFIALQVRALREPRYSTQAKLGDAMGKAQAWISQLENPEYGKVSVATLLELAKAFDTALVIRFVPFSELLDRLPRPTPEDFSLPSFADDTFERNPTFLDFTTTVTRGQHLKMIEEKEKVTSIDTCAGFGGVAGSLMVTTLGSQPNEREEYQNAR